MKSSHFLSIFFLVLIAFGIRFAFFSKEDSAQNSPEKKANNVVTKSREPSENNEQIRSVTQSQTSRSSEPSELEVGELTLEAAEGPRKLSREEITQANSQEQVDTIQRELASELIELLEGLTASTDRARIRVGVQEMAEHFYLLSRVVAVKGFESPAPDSVDPKDRIRIERLVSIWQTNMDLSQTVDQLFRERGLLTHEHVPQTLREWIKVPE